MRYAEVTQRLLRVHVIVALLINAHSNRRLTLLDPGGDGDGRDADAQLVKGETVRGHFAVARDAVVRGHDVVVETAVLIVGDDEQRLFPLGAGAQSLVHLLDQLLAWRFSISCINYYMITSPNGKQEDLPSITEASGCCQLARESP